MELMKLLLHGDCLEKLKLLKENSIDSIVTDPPYGLSFMNKKWDYDVPSTEIWIECLRVLKPGGHLLSFGGSRTYHRMAVRIEDAGFEIRDQIMWVYGSGFPKSLNVGKAIDKLLGNDREVVGIETSQFKIDNYEQNIYGKYKPVMNEKGYRTQEITKGNSVGEGWGTALKPAHEPIVMARKPLSEKTVAENVLRWGTGGLNIDDSRIPGIDPANAKRIGRSYKTDESNLGNSYNLSNEKYRDNITVKVGGNLDGRWPANIIFDEEAGQVLDQQSGISKSPSKVKSGGKTFHGQDYDMRGEDKEGYNDIGGASRFFYCPKASKKDRDEGLDGFEETISEIAQINSQTKLQPNGEYVENKVLPRKNNHPTVKPTALMLYLIKLVTPVGGTVLDCFLGSGSTGKAAVRGGFDFIGIEREEEYIKIAEARIKNEIK